MVEGRELVRCSLESTGWSSVKDSAAVGRKAGRVSLGPVGRGAQGACGQSAGLSQTRDGSPLCLQTLPPSPCVDLSHLELPLLRQVVLTALLGSVTQRPVLDSLPS